MQSLETAILMEALEELEDVLVTRAPVVHAGLRPGLSDRQIDRLMRPLSPLVLPLDLRVLYRWHNGHDSLFSGSYTTLFSDESFISLEEAVSDYASWREVFDMWNPLWFPAFGQGSGAFVTLGDSPDQLAGPLWDFHSHDPDIETAYDSILALVSTTTAMWRTSGSDELEGLLDASLRHEHNPLSVAPDGRRLRTLSKYGTEGWPSDWLEAAGIEAMEPEDDDRVISVADFLAAPQFDRPLRGTLHVRSGSGDWMYGELVDGTGSVEILLLSDQTDNFREVYGGIRAEVRLAPLPESPPSTSFTGEDIRQAIDPGMRDLLPASMFGRFEEHFTADYLVARVIPLSTL